MVAVIASGIVNPEKLNKLNRFVKKIGAEIIQYDEKNKYVACSNLKIADKVSQEIISLKYGGLK